MNGALIVGGSWAAPTAVAGERTTPSLVVAMAVVVVAALS